MVAAPGPPNKIGAEVRAAILDAFVQAGGSSYLVRVANEHPAVFCTLLGKILPMEPAADGPIMPQARNAAAGHPRPGPEKVAIVGPDGVTSFAALQDALSKGGSADLVYFAFDLLHLDGLDLRSRRTGGGLRSEFLVAKQQSIGMALVIFREGANGAGG